MRFLYYLENNLQLMTQQKEEHQNNPLHGITLKQILEQLLAYYGWEGLNTRIQINCFYENPSINSSLKFLRKTPWARTKVEELYISSSHLFPKAG